MQVKIKISKHYLCIAALHYGTSNRSPIFLYIFTKKFTKEQSKKNREK